MFTVIVYLLILAVITYGYYKSKEPLLRGLIKLNLMIYFGVVLEVVYDYFLHTLWFNIVGCILGVLLGWNMSEIGNVIYNKVRKNNG